MCIEFVKYDVLCRLNSLTWMIHFVRQLTKDLKKKKDFFTDIRPWFRVKKYSVRLKSDFVRCHIVL